MESFSSDCSYLFSEDEELETHGHEDSTQHPMELCENCAQPATVLCQQCANHYCSQCSQMRHQHPARRNHQLQALKNPTPEWTPHNTCGEVTPQLQMKGMLADRFQLTSFKDWQQRAIEAAILGKDTLIIQPTGSGKSLCFQFPAVWSKKTTVVITPTVSLMSDQTSNLEARNIKSTFLGTAQKDKSVYGKILSGEYELVFVTPESFFDEDGTPKQLFRQLRWKQQIGLIAIDEAHLLSAWKTFRPKYKMLSGVRDHLPGIPVMALTATATPDVKEEILAVLRDAVTETSSVNKPNIILSVKKIEPPPEGTVVEEQNEKMFTHLAQQIHPIVSDKRAIVYLDAAKHVPRLTIALRQLGLKSCGYHGKNMSSHDKLKALENWKSGDIDAMVSTSAFGMGIDRADVDVVLKIGVPQSLEDLVQMFGRAGRDGRTAQGILLYREDDLQMASYWYDGCRDPTTLTKFQQSWKFVYAHLVGKCRRQVILDYFGEEPQMATATGECCDVCSSTSTTDSITGDYQKYFLIITTTVCEIPDKGEKKIAEWIRGSQCDSTKELKEKCLANTFGSGASLRLSLPSWRILIRQAWLVGLLKRNMKVGVGTGKNRAMVFNTFQLSSEGFGYIDNPHKICLPQLPETAEPSTQQASCVSKSTRVSRGSQALPVIRNLLSDQTKWFAIENPDDYQYPGVFPYELPKRVAYCEDITALPFYDSSNKHFMFEDIQLGKGNTRATRKTTVSINGKAEEIFYKIAPCKGVKACSASGCSYVTSTRESKQCPHHQKSQLQSSGSCPVDFFYVWPTASEDNRRWIGGLVRSDDMLSDNLHNHPINPPSKIPVKVEADIRKAIQANPHLKTSEIMIGKGLDYMPGAASLAATHKGRVKNVRLSALRDGGHADPRACILKLESDAKKYDNSMKENIGVNGSHLEMYQDLGHPYVQDYSVGKEFTWVLCMSPLMAQVLAKADFVEIDATFKASVELENLINIVTFDYYTMQWMIVARIRLNRLDAAAYATCLKAVFQKVKELNPSFTVGETLLGILADWSDTQLKGLEDALGKEVVAKVMKGCQVHFMRSVKRVADRLKECSAESRRIFTILGYAILDATTQDEIETIFKVMCGEAPIDEAAEFLSNSDQASEYMIKHKPGHWASCKKWSEWWRRPRHLRMLSAAFSEMESSVFHWLPNSTNAVESYNRLCKGPTPDVLSVAMMTTYRLDMAAALQHLAVTSGMSVTYERQTPEARSSRASAQSRARAKRRLRDLDDAQGPPDKRKDFGFPATPSRKRRKTQPTLHVSVEVKGPEIEILRSGKMLTDRHVNSASAIIKKDFPDIKGLQSTLNAQRQKGFKPAEEGSIQVLHCGDDYQHWVTTCFMEGQVLLYDSLGQAKATLTPGLKKQVIELYGTTAGEGGVLNIAVPQVQKQSGKTDCGCFAIAWAVHLAYGDKPETIILDQTKLRSHLEACLLKQQFTPFPHTIKKTQRTRSQTLSINLD